MKEIKKEKIKNEKTEKGVRPLFEGVEKRHILKPDPKQQKRGGPPPAIKKKDKK